MRGKVKAVEWAERIKRQEASGLEIVPWCEQENILSTRFYYWKNRLARQKSADNAGFSRVVTSKASRTSSTMPDPVWVAKFVRELMG